MPRDWRERLVDPSASARTASAEIYRRRWREFVVILLVGIPALAASSIGAPADPRLTTGSVMGVGAVAAGFLLWRLHWLEVEGRERWRQRMIREAEDRLRE